MRHDILIMLLCWCGPALAAAADKVYYFVDERGVPHFSNVPADARYKPLEQGSVVAQPAPAVSGVPAPAAPAAPTAVPLAPEEGDDGDDR